MKRALLVTLLSLALLPACTQAQTTRPVPEIKRVVIISIDGLRPDLALRANMPNVHKLMDRGSFTFWARTTAFAITLPSHVSMVTGVSPLKHLIEWNYDLPLAEPVYPKVPTLFELAKKAGYTTALAVGKSKFDVLDKPDTLDWVFMPNTRRRQTNDQDVMAHAVAMIHDHQPEVLFVHFPDTDAAGHTKGWASPEQMAAIERADTCLGEVVTALQDERLLDSTLIILSADHGGAGIGHGPDDPRSRHIPWIAAGPGIRKNYDLTRIGWLNVNTEDTFATACHVLGLPLAKYIEGRAVVEAFEKSELLSDIKTPATQPASQPAPLLPLPNISINPAP